MNRRTLLATSLAALSARTASAEKAPAIKIIKSPPFDKGGPDRMELITGSASGVTAAECRVLIYSRSDTWYVQPSTDSPYTSLSADNTWSAQIHLGFEYAAILVKLGHSHAAAKLDILPVIGGDVLAIVIKSQR